LSEEKDEECNEDPIWSDVHEEQDSVDVHISGGVKLIKSILNEVIENIDSDQPSDLKNNELNKMKCDLDGTCQKENTDQSDTIIAVESISCDNKECDMPVISELADSTEQSTEDELSVPMTIEVESPVLPGILDQEEEESEEADEEATKVYEKYFDRLVNSVEVTLEVVEKSIQDKMDQEHKLYLEDDAFEGDGGFNG